MSRLLHTEGARLTYTISARTWKMASSPAVVGDVDPIETDLCSYRRNARIPRTEITGGSPISDKLFLHLSPIKSACDSMPQISIAVTLSTHSAMTRISSSLTSVRMIGSNSWLSGSKMTWVWPQEPLSTWAFVLL